MVTTTAAQRSRARKLAAEKNIRVVAVARDKQTNRIVAIQTTSHSDPNGQHTVKVFADHLECDCFYAKRTGKPCSHRAVAHDRLVAELDLGGRPTQTRVRVNNQPFSIWR